MDRKTFLKSAAATVAGLVPLAALVEGCASAAQVLHIQVADNKAVVPLASLVDLSLPNSYAKVYVNQQANPILVFAQDNGAINAVLSTCSHSGCEVKKLRTKFECPCHGSEYDLGGNVIKGPAPAPLDTFTVQKFNDRLEILLGG